MSPAVGLTVFHTTTYPGFSLGSLRGTKLDFLTLLPATGGGENTPSAVLAKKNKQVSSGIRQLLFVTLSQTLFGFPKQLSVSLYLLPVLRGRSGSNVQQVTVTSMTTGNSDMTANTENSYSVEIRTASQAAEA